ncbi:MAG: hypothetical protein HYZ26_14720 [Chloroflexi bacterium]|nr:hypothetical protein [Chloroflexota bacterium]
MAETNFHYDEGEGQTLTVAWQGFWQDIQVRLGETVLGKVYGIEELLRGVEFNAPDGGRVRVRFAASGEGIGLQAWRDGVRLVHTHQAALRAVRPAVWALYFVAAQYIFLGTISLIVTFAPGLVFGTPNSWLLFLAMGLVYLGLAAGLQRGSKAALYAALGLYLLETVVSVGLGLALGTPPTAVSIVGRAVVILLLASAMTPLGILGSDNRGADSP